MVKIIEDKSNVTAHLTSEHVVVGVVLEPGLVKGVEDLGGCKVLEHTHLGQFTDIFFYLYIFQRICYIQFL